MNIKVAAFTVSEKSSNTIFCICRGRARSSAIKVLAVLLMLVIPYSVIQVYHYNRDQLALCRTDENVPGSERVQISQYPNKSRDMTQANDTLAEFWQREQAGKYKILNYTELWEEVRAQHYGDTLYPETYDADMVLYALRRSKIIGAELYKKQTSFKFKLTLEGGHKSNFQGPTYVSMLFSRSNLCQYVDSNVQLMSVCCFQCPTYVSMLISRPNLCKYVFRCLMSQGLGIYRNTSTALR